MLQITSEAARVYDAPAQIAMVRALRPEAVSVGLREIDQPAIGQAGVACKRTGVPSPGPFARSAPLSTPASRRLPHSAAMCAWASRTTCS